MSNMPGTTGAPLRVAIIGSGPSGFYAADHLLKQKDLAVEVDLFDRLPTPFGLVRGGVAPDHQKIKTVTKAYDKTAAQPGFRFYGNVEYGRDLKRADLEAHYHAVLYSVGSETDRRMGIPGEDLAGSHPATKFVGWYNAHPDYRGEQFDLSAKAVAVVGVGNVAMDVVRILARSQAELKTTDIADYALAALAKSNVQDIYMLGRRGSAQAAFTTPEIREFGELEEADVIISHEDAEPDALSKAAMEKNPDRGVDGNIEILRELAKRTPAGKPKRIHIRFLVSPVEVVGDGRVSGLKIVKNKLVQSEDGSIRPKATDETEILPVGLVFRSVGYLGLPLPELPFDARGGVLPNREGRILDPETNEALAGHYAAGWIKRGPSGVIGTNKPDAVESIDRMLEDRTAGRLLTPRAAGRDEMEAMLRQRGLRFVTWDDWKKLDALEVGRAQGTGRPRVKFESVEEMLAALGR